MSEELKQIEEHMEEGEKILTAYNVLGTSFYLSSHPKGFVLRGNLAGDWFNSGFPEITPKWIKALSMVILSKFHEQSIGKHASARARQKLYRDSLTDEMVDQIASDAKKAMGAE